MKSLGLQRGLRVLRVEGSFRENSGTPDPSIGRLSPVREFTADLETGLHTGLRGLGFRV